MRRNGAGLDHVCEATIRIKTLAVDSPSELTHSGTAPKESNLPTPQCEAVSGSILVLKNSVNGTRTKKNCTMFAQA